MTFEDLYIGQNITLLEIFLTLQVDFLDCSISVKRTEDGVEQLR